MKHCQHCDVEFATPSSLKRHISAKHSVELDGHGPRSSKHQCPHCDAYFARRETVRRHIRSKHELDLSVCSFCLKQFRADYIFQHKSRCAIKYWRKVQQCVYLNDRTWSLSEDPSDKFQVDSSIPIEGGAWCVQKRQTEILAESRGNGHDLHIVHEHTFKIGLAADAIFDVWPHFVETADVGSFKAALVTGLRLELPFSPLCDRRSSKQCDQFELLIDLSITLDQTIRGDIQVNEVDKWHETVLHKACRAGVADLLEPLFWRGAFFDETSSDGETPLILAIQSDDLDTVRFALTLGSDPNLSWPLRDAWEAGRQDIMTLLVEHGADINRENCDGNSLLLLAIEKESIEDVRFMLSLGADPNLGKPLGTVMHNCEDQECYDCIHEEIACLLVEQGADLVMDRDFTVLHYAARKAHLRLVCAALDRITSSELLEIRDWRGETALLGAARMSTPVPLQQNLDTVSALLDAGANINAPSEDGSALCLAAYDGCEALVQLLLNANADINIQDSRGHSPLALAAEYGHQELVRILLDAGAVVKTADSSERSALSRAASNGHKAIVRYLLKEVPPTHEDRLYVLRTLKDAIIRRQEDIVRDLLMVDASVRPGEVLEHALEWSSSAVVKILLENGATLYNVRPDFMRDLFAVARDGRRHFLFKEVAAKRELLTRAFPDVQRLYT